MLYHMAKEEFRGGGEIVDGGSFFGSSTVALAQGVRDNDRFDDRKVIHAYELGFLPEPESGQTTKSFVGQEYTFGESFVPILETNTAPFQDLVELNIGDLLEHEWDGRPIEICFIDVCMTAELNAHCAKQFYPHIPVGGYLVNQDFFFDRLPLSK